MQITTIGLDIAKNVFQVHGINASEKVVVRKQLRRSQMLAFFQALPPCLVGMEACATAHYWARELTKLGHRVRPMPARDVKAYIKRKSRVVDVAGGVHALRHRPQPQTAARKRSICCITTTDALGHADIPSASRRTVIALLHWY
jgi:transposase